MKQNECGRSMVEMLGVLAIIGVLSVGGIMGYTTAMRKHQANEIVALITQMAMLGHANGLRGITTRLTYQQLTGETSLPTGLRNINTNPSYVWINVDNADVCHAVESHFSSDSTQPLYVPSSWSCDNYCEVTRPASGVSLCDAKTQLVIQMKK